MSRVISVMAGKNRKDNIFITLLMIGYAAFALPLAAQRQGPLPPPPPGTVVPSTLPANRSNEDAARQTGSSHITSEPPAIPVPQIIEKFGRRFNARDE